MKDAQHYWHIWLEATEKEQSAILTFPDVIEAIRDEYEQAVIEAIDKIGLGSQAYDDAIAIIKKVRIREIHGGIR